MGHLLEGFVKGRFIIKTCCIGDFHKCPLLLFWMAEQALHLAVLADDDALDVLGQTLSDLGDVHAGSLWCMWVSVARGQG